VFGIAVYLAAVLNWQGERTVGLSYYGLPQVFGAVEEE
jgi:hypothetical protein